jgi:hypothetical protein
MGRRQGVSEAYRRNLVAVTPLLHRRGAHARQSGSRREVQAESGGINDIYSA